MEHSKVARARQCSELFRITGSASPCQPTRGADASSTGYLPLVLDTPAGPVNHGLPIAHLKPHGMTEKKRQAKNGMCPVIGVGGFNHIVAGSAKQFYRVVTSVQLRGACFTNF